MALIVANRNSNCYVPCRWWRHHLKWNTSLRWLPSLSKVVEIVLCTFSANVSILTTYSGAARCRHSWEFDGTQKIGKTCLGLCTRHHLSKAWRHGQESYWRPFQSVKRTHSQARLKTSVPGLDMCMWKELTMGHYIIVAITEGLPEHETSYRTFSKTIWCYICMKLNFTITQEVIIAFHLSYYIKGSF